MRGGWVATRCIVIAAVVAAVAGCGPVVAGGTASGSAGQDADSGGSTSSLPASSAPSDASWTSASVTSAASSGATTADDAPADTGPTEPPGDDCDPTPTKVETPLPEGCSHAWLVDAEGTPLVGSPSGLVVCPGPVENETVIFRTAAVPCPALVGDQCLCDADCGRGEACICANEVTTRPGLGRDAANRCLPADCAGVDDCGGTTCRVDIGPCVGTYYPEALRCTTPGDDCRFDSDCEGFCDYDETMELFTCDLGGICE